MATHISIMQPFRLTLLVVSCISLAPVRAVAQQRRSYDCPKARTQSALNTCADVTFKSAEARMQTAYAALSRGLADTTRRTTLAEAQKAWLAFRNKYCRFIAGPYRDGSMYPMQLGFCLAGVTDERAKQLRTDLLNERL
jgi:uncharacterized protein YecT (DUF1311 family)